MMAEKSMRNILPPKEILKERLQSLAMLDAILMPEWEERYFSFNNSWDTNESMASMRDGEGNGYFIWLDKEGNIIGKLFDNKKPLNKIDIEELFLKVPKKFDSFLTEPAFLLEDITFMFWSQSAEKEYTFEGFNGNLIFLDFLTTAENYYSWAKKYYEIELDKHIVEKIFNFTPLTEEMIKKLNNELSLDDVWEDIDEITYPIEMNIRYSKEHKEQTPLL